jgi:hypothetical protein
MNLKRGLFFLFVIMVLYISPVYAIQHDGILKYDAGDSGKISGVYGMNPWGHAVLFKNKDAITVTGIKVYGCKFGTGTKKVFVEIWDKDLQRLYRDPVLLTDIAVGKMDVTANNCGAVASWADIPLPDHAVTGDFYVVVFTYSPKPDATTQGMSIGFTQPSSTGTSHTVTAIPNKINDITIQQQYDPTDIDWTIRAYYTKSVATTTSTPVPSLTQQNAQTSTTKAPAATASPTDQMPAAAPVKSESTKAPVGLGLVLSSLIIGIILWKRP